MGHLGRSLPALGEDDRHLDTGEARVQHAVLQLDEERVAVRADVLEADACERVVSHDLVAAGAVAEREAGDGASVEVRPLAQDQPREAPVDHADPVQVAGADDERVRPRRGEEVREVARIVRPVTIHGDDGVVALGERTLEAGDVGTAEALAACPVEHPQAGVLRREAVGHGARPVG